MDGVAPRAMPTTRASATGEMGLRRGDRMARGATPSSTRSFSTGCQCPVRKVRAASPFRNLEKFRHSVPSVWKRQDGITEFLQITESRISGTQHSAADDHAAGAEEVAGGDESRAAKARRKAGETRAGHMTRRGRHPGSTRVPRVGFGVPPKRTSWRGRSSPPVAALAGSASRRDGATNPRDARAPRNPQRGGVARSGGRAAAPPREKFVCA